MFGELKAYARRTCMLPKHAPPDCSPRPTPDRDHETIKINMRHGIDRYCASCHHGDAPEEPVPSRKQLHIPPNHQATNYRRGTFLIHRHKSNTSGLCLGTTARETNHHLSDVAPHSAPISAFVLAGLRLRPDSGSSYTELSCIGGR